MRDEVCDVCHEEIRCRCGEPYRGPLPLVQNQVFEPKARGTCKVCGDRSVKTLCGQCYAKGCR